LKKRAGEEKASRKRSIPPDLPNGFKNGSRLSAKKESQAQRARRDRVSTPKGPRVRKKRTPVGVT